MKAMIAQTYWMLFSLYCLSGSALAQQPRLVLQNGHTDVISSIALSPDKKIIASGSSDKTVRLWESRSGRLLHTLGGNRTIIQIVAFSPSGKIVAGGNGNHLMLWDVESGELKGRLVTGLHYGIDSIAFLDDGETVVVGGMISRGQIRTELPNGDVEITEATSPRYETWQLTWDLKNSKLLKATIDEKLGFTYGLAYSLDGRLVARNQGQVISIWDLKTNVLLHTLPHAIGREGALAFSSNAKRLVSGGAGGYIKLWDIDSGQLLKTLDAKSSWINSLAFSENGKLIASAVKDTIIVLWDAETGDEVRRPKHTADEILWVGFDAADKLLAIGKSFSTINLWNVESEAFSSVTRNRSSAIVEVELFSNGRKARLQLYDFVERPIVDLGLSLYQSNCSPDKRLCGGSGGHDYIGVTDQKSRKTLYLEGHEKGVLAVTFSPVCNLLASGSMDTTIKLWNPENGGLIKTLTGHSNIVKELFFSADGKFLVSFSEDGTIKYWNAYSGAEIATLFIFNVKRRVFVTPDGRFDTNVPFEDLDSLHWIMSDAPMKPLPLEIFVRDYFEPRLLSRLFACRDAEIRDPGACEQQFKPIPPLSELNRIQPKVKILGFKRGASADEVLVDVEARGREDSAQSNGKTKTAAYDLRLFRNGQLVGQWPSPPEGIGGPESLSDWRHSSEVPKPTHTFPVRLATKDLMKPVTFTAYAFNEDRVKSETIQASYPPPDIPRRKAHAYVITIGVNGYQNPKRNLEFAVKDAQDMSQALRQIRDYEVVSVSLVSDASGAAMPKNQATKANIRALLRVLADGVHRGDLAGVANSERLTKATPDDLVILSFSGHGYTERDGAFYLLPSDSGTEDKVTKESLKKFISSEELSEWLREVDAGQMAMIIDACHSAASVDSGGFKPGPMGDRGLGQLAYDKGMRILAASQTDDVALEIRGLRQGLLTYALAWEGLSRGEKAKLNADLNGDEVVTLEEWLKYGEQRVPTLYDDARAGKLHIVSKDPVGSFEQIVKRAQTPALFDFHKNSEAIVIEMKRASGLSGAR